MTMKFLNNYSIPESNWNPTTREILKSFRNIWLRVTQAIETNGIFYNEVRNYKRTATKFDCLKNSSGKLITNKQVIAIHFNYVFFNQLRAFKFNNKDRKYQADNHHSVPLHFSFRFVTSHECLRVLLDLNKDKPLIPSGLPAWALELGSPELAKPLFFLFNE